MSDEPDALVSIEIEGQVWIAADPRLICRGECDGPIVYISNRDGRGVNLDQRLGDAALNDVKRIYLCDAASTALRPLISSALGFVFGEGEALGHFAGLLRQRHIPACIDHQIWRSMRAEVMQNSSVARGRLCCGGSIVLSDGFQAQYHAQLQSYQKRLVSLPLVIPVYDVARKTLWTAAAVVEPLIGEKGLVVNALKAEGLPAVSALLLTHLDEWGIKLEDDIYFLSLVAQIFPGFGHTTGYTLIVRGSLYSEDGSHASWSGLIPSPSVNSIEELTKVVAAQVSRWQGVRDRTNDLGLSIVIQERIAHKIRGILGTGRPWDYSSQGIVVELTFDPRNGEGQSLVFLDDVEADLHNGNIYNTARFLAKSGAPVDEERFSDMFSRLVCDALNLRDRYTTPLDIEFVLTEDLNYRLVQFRPLFRL